MFAPLRLLPALLLLLCLPARAEEAPRVLSEGLVVRLEPGLARWKLDGERIRGQVGLRAGEVDPLLVDQTENAFGLLLQLGYNILGHATLAVDLSGSGWDLGSTQRGGAGFVAGSLAWHPARLLEMLDVLPQDVERRWDASLYFGAGYGVVGEDRAMDGLHLTLGLRAEYFLTRWLSAGLDLRLNPLRFSRYVIDWEAGVDIALPDGSGGSLFFPALTLAVHAPVGG